MDADAFEGGQSKKLSDGRNKAPRKARACRRGRAHRSLSRLGPRHAPRKVHTWVFDEIKPNGLWPPAKLMLLGPKPIRP